VAGAAGYLWFNKTYISLAGVLSVPPPNLFTWFIEGLWIAYWFRTSLPQTLPLSLDGRGPICCLKLTMVALSLSGFWGQDLPKWTPVVRQQESICFITDSVCNTNQIDIQTEWRRGNVDCQIRTKTWTCADPVQINSPKRKIKMIAPHAGRCCIMKRKHVSKVRLKTLCEDFIAKKKIKKIGSTSLNDKMEF